MPKEFRITPVGRGIERELSNKFFTFIQRDPGAIRNTSQEDQTAFGILGVLNNLVNADEPGGYLESGATFRNIVTSMTAFGGFSLGYNSSEVRRFIKLAAEAGWLVESDDDEDLVPRPRRRSGRRLFT